MLINNYYLNINNYFFYILININFKIPNIGGFFNKFFCIIFELSKKKINL